MDVVNMAISSVVQVVIFSIIPVVWWAMAARKTHTFWQWIGLVRPKLQRSRRTWLLMVGVALLFVALSLGGALLVRGVETATQVFYGGGVAAVPLVVLYAVVKTSLSEEILFRGFMLKRVAARYGFSVGNAVQAALFGLVHGALFFSLTGPWVALLIMLCTGVIGWLLGYANERLAGGSILPSWGIHAAANIVAGLSAVFGVM